MFSLPDKGEGVHDRQSIFFQEYLDVLVAGIMGTDCVLSGCAVAAQGSPDMTVAIAKGSVLSNGALFAVTAGNVAIGAADATNPRFDLVVVSSAGAKAVRAGTAAANPKPPARNSNDVVLAVVYVPAADTAIDTAQINDLRIQRGGSGSGGGAPMLLKKVVAAVTFNTSVAANTFFSVTLPSGLFLTGQTVHVEIGGTMLFNSGTPTLTLSVQYGGTTMFQDVGTAAVASAVRIPWRLEFDLCARGNVSQTLNGCFMLGQISAKTAPANGTGELLLPAAVANLEMSVPFNGTAAVDSDAADRLLAVVMTMNVSNVANEIVCDFGTATLI